MDKDVNLYDLLMANGAHMRALESTYPVPDNPHDSVIQRAMDNRIAFRKGWDMAINAVVQALDIQIEDSARLDWLQEKKATLTRLYNDTGYILAVDGKAIRTGIEVRSVIDYARFKE